jgi:hypothetical protein
MSTHRQRSPFVVTLVLLWPHDGRAAEPPPSLAVHAGPAFWQQGTVSCMTDYDVVACSPINFRSVEFGASLDRQWFRGQVDGVIGGSPEGGIASYRLIAVTATPRAVLAFGWGDLSAGPRAGVVVLSDFPTDPGRTSHQFGFAGGLEAGARFHLGKYLALEPAAAFVLTPLPHPGRDDPPIARDYGTTWWVAASLRLHVNLTALASP